MPANATQIDQDLALVRRMLQGEERAMSEFCSHYLPRLYRFALQRVPTPEDADDVVQVVLSNAARRIETYRGQSTLFSWLVVICRHEVARLLAAVNRDQEVVKLYADGYGERAAGVPGPVAEQPDAVAVRQQILGRVHESLDRLPERQARALELKYIDGYSSKEIAEQLDLSDDAVQSLLARARRAFRAECDERILEELSGQDPELQRGALGAMDDTTTRNGDDVRLE